MTSAKLKKLLMACLAIVFCFSVFGVVNPPAVSAKNVSVGSSLFTDINNISVSATENGLELTSKGQAKAEATYMHRQYMGDFSMAIRATELNFQTITLTFLSHNNSNDIGLVKDIENVLKLTKGEDGKISAALNGGNAVSTGLLASENIFIKYNGNSSDPAFTLSASKTGAVAATFDNVNSIYINEAKLKIGLSGIVVTESGTDNLPATIAIVELNGQSFKADDNAMVNDNIAATLRLPKDKLFTDMSNETVYAKTGRKITIPAYGMDVISSSFTYEMEVEYKDTEDGDTWKNIVIATGEKNGLSFTPKRAGEYRITSVSVRDGNDNSTSIVVESEYDFQVSEDNPINIVSVSAAQWPDTKPVVDHSSYLAAHNNGVTMRITCTDDTGNIFRFAKPDVTVAMPDGITENADSLTYTLMYKLPTSNSWQSVSGLDFNAKFVNGEYSFYVQVTDRWGNVSEQPEPYQYIKIEFKDQTTPKLVVSNFPETKYVNQTASLPSGVATDIMDSSLTKLIEIFMLEDEKGNIVWLTDEDGNLVYETDEDGNEILDDEGNKIKQRKLISSSSSATFTPEEKGLYEVIYTVEDSSGNKTEPLTLRFKVIDAPAAPRTPFIDINDTWTIVLLSIAGLSLIGIIVLLFVKPAEED